MLIYFFMFGMAVMAGTDDSSEHKKAVTVAVMSLVFVIIIGMRHEVGGDWPNYLRAYQKTALVNVAEWQDISSDFGYAALNLLSRELGTGIYGVNFVCGAILMTGIAIFAMAQPSPRMVLVAATPYLIIVVGMGYTRQSVAVGFELIAIILLFRKNVLGFLLLTLLAALFHKSAIVILPLALTTASKRSMMMYLVVISGAIYGAYSMFVAEHAESYWENYIEAQYSSAGAIVRLSMTLFAGIAFFLLKGKLQLADDESRFWSIVTFAAVFAFVLVPFSSTAADRLGLYLIPLQLFVAGRLHFADRSYTFLVSLLYFLTLAVWLNFAVHAFAWLPYQFAPFVAGSGLP